MLSIIFVMLDAHINKIMETIAGTIRSVTRKFHILWLVLSQQNLVGGVGVVHINMHHSNATF